MTTATQAAGIKAGRVLRDEGMALTHAADHARDGIDTKVIDQAIRHLASQDDLVWSANDLRELLPEVRQPLIGERIRAAARSAKGRPSLIVHVGYTPSSLPNTRGHEIKTWRGRREDLDNVGNRSP